MNLPNKLTLMRIFLIPVLVALIVVEQGRPYTFMGALAIFIVATISDIADGRIARKNNLVTDFGKLMDPLADKMMICSALICFVELNYIPAWFAIVVVFREFMISGFRLIATENGLVIAANSWGKRKTGFQTAFIIGLLALPSFDVGLAWEGLYISASCTVEILETMWCVVINALAWITLFLTVYSLAVYMRDNWKVMGNQF